MNHYAIIGGGRLARHFSEYFQKLDIPHACWTRDRCSAFNSFENNDAEMRLRETVAQAQRVLLLVSDTAISSLLKQYPFLHDKQLIHCSGALSFPGIAGAHPLMTFADDLYDLGTYQSIPFMLEAGYDFADLFPGLINPHYVINVEEKARYHAFCVMAGNFSQILWKEISGRFTCELGLPAETLHPYLSQLSRNFLQSPDAALTGPLVRDDRHTINRNLHSLNNDPLQRVYAAFVDFYQSGNDQAELVYDAVAEPLQMEKVV